MSGDLNFELPEGYRPAALNRILFAVGDRQYEFAVCVLVCMVARDLPRLAFKVRGRPQKNIVKWSYDYGLCRMSADIADVCAKRGPLVSLVIMRLLSGMQPDRDEAWAKSFPRFIDQHLRDEDAARSLLSTFDFMDAMTM